METTLKKQIKFGKSNILQTSKKITTVKSAYEYASPYLTQSKVCSICGTSSDVISM
ncbi:hypothetical protein [Abyssalbus ytuae]|uniref:Uncharacterized protein n=1 Tax=Abyssalbus ytuae TaxID=2926907 RepID=A0A9E7D2B4_9FLAO|nr:hypothetical protein [Abyssalbus ytuae]UOB16509.1 hypothetical protein MQE35_12265 [Abyssalbus ytuae]